MKGFTLLCLACSSAMGQVVQLTPTNYSQTTIVQNNLGRFWPSWQTASRERIDLSGRVLVFTQTTFTDKVPYLGTKLGGPKRLETRYVYRQIGASTYRPVGGERITYFTGVSSTNLISAAEMQTVWWYPSQVGTITAGDGLTRTVTTGSRIQCWGRNLSSEPYNVRIQSTCGPVWVVFEGSEIKLFDLTAPGEYYLDPDL